MNNCICMFRCLCMYPLHSTSNSKLDHQNRILAKKEKKKEDIRGRALFLESDYENRGVWLW